jgi:myo-inositol 2-dehydrogenase/D-chiro-inositol 1-dehydrogenase
MEQLGVGLVGCGWFGQHLALTLGSIDGARLVAVADIDRAAAEAFGREMGVPAHVGHAALVADPQVGALIIAVPHSEHEAVAVDGARAGKHIFCEKPMAIDTAACYRMLDAAESNGAKLMVGQVVRLYPLFRRVAGIVERGTLGQLVAFTYAALYNIPRVDWWARAETMGALLHSPGVHDLDFMRSVCGEACSVFAREAPVRVQQGVEYADVACVLIEFAGGALGALQSSVSSLVPCRRGDLIGTQGTLAFDADVGVIEYATSAGERERIDLRGADDEEGVRSELQSFVNWVRYNERPLLTAWDGLRAVEIIEAAYRSIREGRIISLPLERPEADGAAFGT